MVFSPFVIELANARQTRPEGVSAFLCHISASEGPFLTKQWGKMMKKLVAGHFLTGITVQMGGDVP
jgi:hypothetical protein